MTPRLYEIPITPGFASISKSYGDECHLRTRKGTWPKHSQELMKVNFSRQPADLLPRWEFVSQGSAPCWT